LGQARREFARAVAVVVPEGDALRRGSVGRGADSSIAEAMIAVGLPKEVGLVVMTRVAATHLPYLLRCTYKVKKKSGKRNGLFAERIWKTRSILNSMKMSGRQSLHFRAIQNHYLGLV
jgi:hypothetical protein